MDRRIKSFKAAFASKEAFLAAIETKESAEGRLENRNPWTNEDLDISPKSHWTWGWWDYAAFWWSYGRNLSHTVDRPRLIVCKAFPLVSGLLVLLWFHLE